MRGGVRNLKHKELYERFNLQKDPKPKRVNFIARVTRYGYTKETAINPKLLQGHTTKNYVGEEGRVCNGCEQYKLYDEYYKTTGMKNGYTTRCKQCRNEAKKKYRKENREHYLELKRNRRRLSEGTKVMFFNPLNTYTVVKYEKGKSHLLVDGEGMYRRLDVSNEKAKWKVIK